MAAGNPALDIYFERGWAIGEGAARWTVGPSASIVFAFTGPLPPNPALHLEATTLPCPARAEQVADVYLNDDIIGVIRLNSIVRSAVMPIRNVEALRRPFTRLELRPHDLRSPAEVGCIAEDPRALGLFVQQLWIE